jgi:hypothetical protein
MDALHVQLFYLIVIIISYLANTSCTPYLFLKSFSFFEHSTIEELLRNVVIEINIIIFLNIKLIFITFLLSSVYHIIILPENEIKRLLNHRELAKIYTWVKC